MYLNRCDEDLLMSNFIENTLCDILKNIGNGKSQITIIGVGSGEGNHDLEMISQLSLKHPRVLLDYKVVEPSGQQLQHFRETVARTSNLEHVKFTWNQMSTSEFEEQWRRTNVPEKADFIHMVQMMYFVEDPAAVIGFFHGLLNKNGKLLIVQASSENIVIRAMKAVHGQLSQIEGFSFLSAADIKRVLDVGGVTYQSYELQTDIDVTECFSEGDENGELLLDFLTSVQDFSKKASPELRAEVLRLLRDPQRSVEREGRVLVNSSAEALVVDASH
ncbi:histamine N-methyltransferase-like isoform X2 [Eucyclogobius newberryi]